ncbi:MAG: hypothetical protein QOE05_1963, partial [Actinomycetota bacterium]|nr:hypothetical protein [Actinomycetota bacterium]
MSPDRRRTAGATIAAGVLSLAVFAAPAFAAVTAQDDAMNAAPAGVVDVLANDSSSDGESMTVTANSQPSSGTASCSALGACFYSATGGFTGSDSFTYTVTDAGGETATATVDVNVDESTTQLALEARDDQAATLAGRAINIQVLANDSGTGLEVTGASDPVHGTVQCPTDGNCRYEPDAGHTGSDGFEYTVSDSSEQTKTAQAHILIAPANAAYGVITRGTAIDSRNGAVAPGGNAQWGVGATSTPGLSGEELRALGLPSLSASLSGPHAVTGGTLANAPGWTSSLGGDGVLRSQAGDDAVLGESRTQFFPRPLPPVHQGTGGDGHVPILVGSKVFGFYHHNFRTSATCVDRTTGALCPGYPKRLDFGTTDINGPGVVMGSKLYTHLIVASGFAQSASIGLFCWDADTDSTCGLTIVDRVPKTSDPGASAPVLAGGKMWFGGDTGKLYCVDPATGVVCAPLDTGLPPISETENYDIVSHGSRVFLARRGGGVACVDVTAGARCSGWETPKSFEGRWNVVNQHDAGGATIGVCVFFAQTGSCVTDANPAVAVPVANFVNHDPYTQGYSHSLEAEFGTRTLVGSLSENGVGCYDWSTMAPCTGGDYDAEGWLRVQDNGESLPYGTYGVASDGSCGIALGDPGQVFTVDPAGTSPCLSLGTGTDRTTVDLRDQRCDGTVGAAKWRNVRLQDTDDEEMDSVVVTVRDEATGEVLAQGEMVGGEQTLDLSGIDPAAHPAITIDATARSTAGSAAWDDAIPPRITVGWTSDPQQLCVRTKGDGACGSAASGIAVLGRLTSPGSAESQAQLSLLRNPCPIAVAGGVAGAQSRSCLGKRLFRIHVVYKGKDVRRITATVRGKKQRLIRMRPRPVFRVDLRRYARQRVVLRITIITKAGKRLTGTRVYHP